MAENDKPRPGSAPSPPQRDSNFDPLDELAKLIGPKPPPQEPVPSAPPSRGAMGRTGGAHVDPTPRESKRETETERLARLARMPDEAERLRLQQLLGARKDTAARWQEFAARHFGVGSVRNPSDFHPTPQIESVEFGGDKSIPTGESRRNAETTPDQRSFTARTLEKEQFERIKRGLPLLDPGRVLSAEELAKYDLRQDVAAAIDKHQGPAVKTAQDQSMSHGSPTDRTLSTFLDYTGLGAILIAIEEIGRRWIEEQPITQHVAVAAGAFLIAGAVSLVLARWVKTAPPASISRNRLALSFNAVAHSAVTWLVTAAVIVFGIPLTFWAVSPKASAPAVQPPAMLCFDGPCAPVRLKPAPQYLKPIGVGVAGPVPLMLNAISAVTTDRLRVFVDYSEYRSGWMPKTRAFIGELKEPVKDSAERLQLIYMAKKENGGTNILWWGDPSQNHAVSTSTFVSDPLPAIIVRARVAIVGATGEQHYYFILLRAAVENAGTHVGIIPEHDSGDWIEKWENE